MASRFLWLVMAILILTIASVMLIAAWFQSEGLGAWMLGLSWLAAMAAIGAMVGAAFRQAWRIDRWMDTQDELTRGIIDCLYKAYRRQKDTPVRKDYRNPNSPEFGGIRNEAE